MSGYAADRTELRSPRRFVTKMSVVTNAQKTAEGMEASRKLEELKTKIVKSAADILNNSMPQKIASLTSLFSTHPDFNIPDDRLEKTLCGVLFSDMANDNGIKIEEAEKETKKRKLNESGSVSLTFPNQEFADSVKISKFPRTRQKVGTNAHISRMVVLVKQEILEAIDIISILKTWIQLNIPRIEDGNNFGVSVQEEIVGELSRAEDSCFQLLDSIHKYYMSRAKLVSKVLKYPGLADYERGVLELDVKQYTMLRFTCMDIRNTYAVLNDLIAKNLDKINKPRDSEAMHSMY